jgi:hypothetical protein
VDHASLVRVVQAAADLDHDAQLVVQRQAVRWRHGLDQVETLQQLHRDVGRTRDVAQLVDGDDVRVRQACGRARLALEAPQELGVGRQLGRDRLEGDRPVEYRVAGAVHGPHPTLAETVQHFEFSDGLQETPRSRRVRRRPS